jgi:transposase InsO family protein
MNALKRLVNSRMTKDLPNFNMDSFDCFTCMSAKAKRLPFPKSSIHISSSLGDLIHSDICGPLPTPSYTGYKYFLTFTDDYSRYVWTYPLKTKAAPEVFSKLKELDAFFLNHHGFHIKILRTDNGSEFKNKIFQSYCQENGILQQFTVPYSPQQNGVAERLNQTLLNSIRSMLTHSKVSHSLWAEALQTATYIKNRSPSAAIKENKTPFEILYKKPPAVSHFRIFGEIAYAVNNKSSRKKLQIKAHPLIFVGYSFNSPGYRLFDSLKLSIVIARDVSFPSTPMFQQFDPPTENRTNSDQSFFQVTFPSTDENPQESQVTFPSIDENLQQSLSLQSSNSSAQPQTIPDYRIITTSNILTSRLRSAAHLSLSAPNIPRKYSDIQYMSEPHKSNWYKACDDEINGLQLHETWSLVPAPEDRKIIGSVWVFKLKYDAHGQIVRYKARLCCQGFHQIPGIDFHETFAPTGRMNSLRIFLSLAAHYDLNLHQIDIVQAFLIAKLDHEIYMRQPPGYEDQTNNVCLLHKTLYGLKQSPHLWNQEINNALVSFGFNPNPVDPCLYSRKEASGGYSFLFLWVDDIIIAANEIEPIVSSIKKLFDIKDLGPLKYCLNLQVERNRKAKTLILHQSHYIQTIIDSVFQTDVKTVSTPRDPSVILIENHQPSSITSEYQSLLGHILYLSICTRPDIASAVGELSRFSKNPSPIHFDCLKRIVRYLKGTSNMGVVLGGENIALKGWSDSNFAGDVNTRKSTSGYVFKLANGPISWSSKMQKTVALSSCEAEYMSLAHAVQEALWIKSLLGQYLDFNEPMVIYEDNQGAIDLTVNSKNHSRTKHIDIKYHFLKEKVRDKEIQVKFCSTSDMIADIFTKPLGSNLFKRFSNMLNLQEIQEFRGSVDINS